VVGFDLPHTIVLCKQEGSEKECAEGQQVFHANKFVQIIYSFPPKLFTMPVTSSGS
jgi:hypothetical protein